MKLAERMRLFLLFSRKRSPDAENVHDSKPGFRAEKIDTLPGKHLGFIVGLDPTIPQNEIRMIDHRGRVVSRLVNIDWKEPKC